jgi:AraC family transcriptional regulator
MDVTINQLPALTLAGHAVEVPLQHRGVNPAIQQHIAALPMEAHLRLKELSDTDPAGILAVTVQEQPDAAEGSPVTYLHGVAVARSTVPDDLDTVTVEPGAWAVFHSSGPHPQALQDLWAATATEWFPSNPWRLRPGPSLVRYLELTPERATCELWLPVERG